MRTVAFSVILGMLFAFATCGGGKSVGEEGGSRDAATGADRSGREVGETKASEEKLPEPRPAESLAEPDAPDASTGQESGPESKPEEPQTREMPVETPPTEKVMPDATSGPVIENPGKCYALSTDPNSPLAIDGTFDNNSKRWRRPHDDPAVCPATALTPQGKALVPYIAYTFCNKDTKAHKFRVEMLSQKGPKGENPLDDPYLFLYTGEGFPADVKQCLAVNDDIPESLNTPDSEITGITVPAGGSITVVGTTVTFDPNDNTGKGYYILVVAPDEN